MKTNIDQLWAEEILDSRGHPTVRATVTLRSGVVAAASVPSGASTGRREACELRDRDSSRFFGKGVLKAISNINSVLGPLLVCQDVLDQRTIDTAMCQADGTPNKEWPAWRTSGPYVACTHGFLIKKATQTITNWTVQNSRENSVTKLVKRDTY